MRSSLNGKAVIRTARSADIRQIAELHQQAFTGFFLTQLGISFLSRYYSIVHEYNKGILLIAETHEGQIIGFVAGFLDPNRFYSLMKARRLELALAILPSLLRRPSILFRILSNYHDVSSSGKGEMLSQCRWCELSSVAIDPEHSGKGIGKDLVNALIVEAEKLGATLVYLHTDAIRNNRTNDFYQKIGFILHAESTKYKGRRMNEYRMVLPKPCKN